MNRKKTIKKIANEICYYCGGKHCRAFLQMVKDGEFDGAPIIAYVKYGIFDENNYYMVANGNTYEATGFPMKRGGLIRSFFW